MARASKPNRPIVETAFALGGYGGNNFHGMGFLHAAHEAGVVPDMISCTSGQIDIVWKYLLTKNGHLSQRYGVSTLAELADIYLEEAEIHPKKYPFPEILKDVPKLLGASISHLADLGQLLDNRAGYLMNITMNNMPARLTVPEVEDGALRAICDAFNSEAGIGIAFNSYDPKAGHEIVYLNPRAMDLLQRQPGQMSSFRNRDIGTHRTEYQPMTPKGVMDALWIYEYGFEGRSALDGAYFRQIMLAEVSRALRIFVARPIQATWTDAMPITWGEKEDLKTEIFFNAAYLGERFRIELVNRLLRDGALTPEFVESEGYHAIDIFEVEPRNAQPFITYFTENRLMFDEAAEDTAALFASLGDLKKAA